MQLTNTTSPLLERKINFGAGPAALPLPVLNQFCQDLINFRGTGVGVAELSHRGEAFEQGILKEAKERFFRLTGYSQSDWTLLWMTGGGTAQFSAIPMNFLAENSMAVYLLSGTWSEKAAQEAERLFPGRVLRIELRCRNEAGQLALLSQDALAQQLTALNHSQVAYLYACDNETVDGVELPSPDWITAVAGGIPVILDCSSNFLSRPLPPQDSSVELIFAGVQKNLGAAGVSLVLKRRKRSGNAQKTMIPVIMDYGVMEKNDSLLNTPPVMNIHLCSLMMAWLLKTFPGGLTEIDAFSKRKADRLYTHLSNCQAFYSSIDTRFQSRMNVVFHAKRAEDELALLKAAEGAGMIQLKGHRSVGGLRASLYNAITEAQVEELVKLLF